MIWIPYALITAFALAAADFFVKLAAGKLSNSIVTFGLYATFGAGAPISVASPIIRLGGLLLAGLAGVILLREPLTLRYTIGVALVLGGMYLVIIR